MFPGTGGDAVVPRAGRLLDAPEVGAPDGPALDGPALSDVDVLDGPWPEPAVFGPELDVVHAASTAITDSDRKRARTFVNATRGKPRTMNSPEFPRCVRRPTPYAHTSLTEDVAQQKPERASERPFRRRIP